MLDSHRRWMCVLTALIFLMSLLIAMPILGQSEPNYAARLTAHFHLQIQVDRVEAPEFMTGACQVRGQIVHLFRARSASLEVGDRIDIPVLCQFNEESDGEDEASALAALENARFIEMYLNPSAESGLELADNQFMIIAEPSEQPQCETDKIGVRC